MSDFQYRLLDVNPQHVKSGQAVLEIIPRRWILDYTCREAMA